MCYDMSKKSDIKEPIAGNLAQKSALLLKLGFCDQRETQGNRQNDKGVHSIGRVASEIVFQPGGHVSGRVASKTAFQKAGENCVGARSTDRVSSVIVFTKWRRQIARKRVPLTGSRDRLSSRRGQTRT